MVKRSGVTKDSSPYAERPSAIAGDYCYFSGSRIIDCFSVREGESDHADDRSRR